MREAGVRAPGKLHSTTAWALLLCCAVGPLAACHRSADPGGAVPRPVVAQAPARRSCSDTARFSGNVEPLVRVELAFKRGGYVQRVLEVREGAARRLVDQGDMVREGQILASLRAGDYEVKLQQVRALLAQAKVAEKQARQDLERARALRTAGSVAPAAYEAAESAAELATAQVQAAAAQVEEARLAVADCELRAPFSAQVIKRVVEQGALVGPGTPGFVLADTHGMKVVFGVPDLMLERVRPGAAVEVSILGAPYPGKVGRVAAAADQRSRLFDVEVVLPNADRKLRVGMIASLRLLGDPAAPAPLAVPLSAVVRPPGETSGFAVFVVAEGGALAMRRVELGEFCGADVEIRSGLAASDQVVTEGASAAHAGERVAVVPHVASLGSF